MLRLGLHMVWCLVLVLPFPLFAQDPIYVYEDNQGKLFFSDNPQHEGFKGYNKAAKQQKRVSKDKIADAIQHYAQRYQMDAKLIRAVIKAESNFDPKAISHAGAQGLMQLMPQTAKLLSVKDPFDPEENIRGGVSYLEYLLRRFEGDLTIALAAYNAGPTAVDRYGGVPPYPETIHYIREVLLYYNQLKSMS